MGGVSAPGSTAATRLSTLSVSEWDRMVIKWVTANLQRLILSVWRMQCNK